MNDTLFNAASASGPKLDPRRVQFPYFVRVGNVSLSIFPYKKEKGEKTYISYRFYWRDGQDKRQPVESTDLNTLITAARGKAAAINSGNLDALELTNADKRAYLRVIDLLKPTGVLLETAVSEYVQARSIVEGGSILEAARFFVERNPKNLITVTLPALVEKCLEAKARKGRSINTINGPTSRLSRYAETHPGPALEELKPERIEAFLDTVKPVNAHKGRVDYSPRTLNNFLRDIGNVINFGKAKGYLPSDFNPLAGIDKRTEPGKEEEVYTPAEMKCLLSNAGLPAQLFLVTCGFAGLRHSEAMRLEITDICLKEGVINVRASKTKKKVRRPVPINNVLKSWLKLLLPLRIGAENRPGFVIGVNNISKVITRLSAKTGVEWRHNALRNTYLSSRVINEKNLAVIAMDAGTSPATIRSNYLHVVSKIDARAWFKIMPPMRVNVIDLPKQKASAVT